jgi:hypothetical protein
MLHSGNVAGIASKRAEDLGPRTRTSFSGGRWKHGTTLTLQLSVPSSTVGQCYLSHPAAALVHSQNGSVLASSADRPEPRESAATATCSLL